MVVTYWKVELPDGQAPTDEAPDWEYVRNLVESNMLARFTGVIPEKQLTLDILALPEVLEKFLANFRGQVVRAPSAATPPPQPDED